MGNYTPHIYADVIIYPCPNPEARVVPMISQKRISPVIMDIYNSIMDIHTSIMDIHNC